MGPDITIRVGEIGRGLAPCARIRGAARNIGRDGGARKLPDADAITAELHGGDASAVRVVIRAKRVCSAVDAAAGVVVIRGHAVGGDGRTCLFPLDAHGASR